jgi:hypothetical protein
MPHIPNEIAVAIRFKPYASEKRYRAIIATMVVEMSLSMLDI